MISRANRIALYFEAPEPAFGRFERALHQFVELTRALHAVRDALTWYPVRPAELDELVGSLLADAEVVHCLLADMATAEANERYE